MSNKNRHTLVANESARLIFNSCYITHTEPIFKRHASEITNKVLDHTFCMFKSNLKNKIITSYNDKCIDPNTCVPCMRKALDVHGLVLV